MSDTGTIQREPARARGPERPAPGQGRPLAGAVEAREALWLYELTQGASVAQIARRSHLSCRQVQLGVAKARKREEARLQTSSGQDSRGQERLQERKDGGDPRRRGGTDCWEDPRQLPRLVPLFPIGPFTPASACPHHGPIRPGSVFCCMVCSRSGMDGHPALKRNPRTDPRPEPRARRTGEGRPARDAQGAAQAAPPGASVVRTGPVLASSVSSTASKAGS